MNAAEIKEIKEALKKGKTVNWKCRNYIVTYNDATDELFVICLNNDHIIAVGKWHKSEDFTIGGAK